MNKFVIIIPFYNAEKYIERCLMSALTQRHGDYKIVIVNDSSTDKSNKIVTNILDVFSYKCDVEYVINKKRMGAMYNHQKSVFV